MILLYFCLFFGLGWGISLCLSVLERVEGWDEWVVYVGLAIISWSAGLCKGMGWGGEILCVLALTQNRQKVKWAYAGAKTPKVNPHTCPKMKYSNPNFLSANNCLFNSSCFSSFSTRITFWARVYEALLRPKTDYLHCLFWGRTVICRHWLPPPHYVIKTAAPLKENIQITSVCWWNRATWIHHLQAHTHSLYGCSVFFFFSSFYFSLAAE